MHFKIKLRNSWSEKVILEEMSSSKVEKTNFPGVLKLRKKRKPSICILANNAVVKRAADRVGLLQVGQGHLWNVLWTDLALTVQQCLAMQRFQMVNYFPGIGEISRKDLLARNLSRMQKIFPEDYDFFPKTWWLPADFKELQQFARQQRGAYFIVKPGSSSQGRGIFISRNVAELECLQQFICQQYIAAPLLIDDYKFDMRVYTLVTSCDPLRLYAYNEGIARFATQKYAPPSPDNVANVFMHLTNYSINKHSHAFLKGEKGSKRRISAINAWLTLQGFDADLIWRSTDDVIIKTVITAAENLKRQYKMSFPRHPQGCFILLGFDVMLDSNRKPHVIEVNRCPSLNTDSALDAEIKEQLLVDIFSMLNLSRLDHHRVREEERRRVFETSQQAIRKMSLKAAGNNNAVIAEEPEETSPEVEASQRVAQVEWEEAHLGNFRLVYPSADSGDYDKYFAEAATCSSLFQETAASLARKAAVLKQMHQVNEVVVPAFEDFSLDEAEVRTAGGLVSRGRITSLNSFEPSFINLAEERERLKERGRRETQLRVANLRATVVAAMAKNGLLRPADLEDRTPRVRYSVLPKVHPDLCPLPFF